MNYRRLACIPAMVALSAGLVQGQDERASSYAPVVPKESFSNTLARMMAEKPVFMNRQQALLKARYDLRDPKQLEGLRLLTLEDTVEYFNLVLALALTEGEKGDLLAFLYTL